MFYRKKPVTVEAVIWNGKNKDEIIEFCGYSKFKTIEVGYDPVSTNFEEQLFIVTLEGEMKAEKGDYIIKGVRGEFYPCKPDIFKQTYEKVAQ